MSGTWHDGALEDSEYPNCKTSAGTSTSTRMADYALTSAVICEAKMTKDELIVKQQLEIEELKEAMKENKEACNTARLHLIHAEQWNSKCNEFPRVAMCAIINARDALEGI